MDAEQLTSHPQIIAVPSDRLWFDPMALNKLTQYSTTNILCPANADTQIAPPNPARWGIGVFKALSDSPPQIGPWTDPGVANFSMGTTLVDPYIFTLQSFGTLICAGWYARPTFAPLTLRIVELIRV